MKEGSIHAGNVTTRQLQRVISLNTMQDIHEEKNYQATDQSYLSQHQRAIRERMKYPCRECDYQETSKGDLTPHQRAIHEGKQFPCRGSDHHAKSKGHLTQHLHYINLSRNDPIYAFLN